MSDNAPQHQPDPPAWRMAVSKTADIFAMAWLFVSLITWGANVIIALLWQMIGEYDKGSYHELISINAMVTAIFIIVLTAWRHHQYDKDRKNIVSDSKKPNDDGKDLD